MSSGKRPSANSIAAPILSKRLTDADDTTRTLLADMTDAVSRADKIIGGLLSYSRERKLDVAPVDLNATIEASLRLVKHELDTARLEIVTDLDPSLPLLRRDRFKRQQVFVNLLSNALHAMGENGTIRLRTSLTKATAGRPVGYGQGDRFAPGEAVAVAQFDDSDPGTPAEIHHKIPEPSRTKRRQGLQYFLDLVMPDADGTALAAEIKSDPVLGVTPIVFLTALISQRGTRGAARQIGGHPFLAKPVDPDIVLTYIDQYARNRVAV